MHVVWRLAPQITAAIRDRMEERESAPQDDSVEAVAPEVPHKAPVRPPAPPLKGASLPEWAKTGSVATKVDGAPAAASADTKEGDQGEDASKWAERAKESYNIKGEKSDAHVRVNGAAVLDASPTKSDAFVTTIEEGDSVNIATPGRRPRASKDSSPTHSEPLEMRADKKSDWEKSWIALDEKIRQSLEGSLRRATANDIDVMSVGAKKDEEEIVERVDEADEAEEEGSKSSDSYSKSLLDIVNELETESGEIGSRASFSSTYRNTAALQTIVASADDPGDSADDDDEFTLSTANVSTAPRDPPVKLKPPRQTLAQEREALKLREKQVDTNIAVNRMREKLKKMGLLGSSNDESPTLKPSPGRSAKRAALREKIDLAVDSQVKIVDGDIVRNCEDESDSDEKPVGSEQEKEVNGIRPEVVLGNDLEKEEIAAETSENTLDSVDQDVKVDNAKSDIGDTSNSDSEKAETVQISSKETPSAFASPVKTKGEGVMPALERGLSPRVLRVGGDATDMQTADDASRACEQAVIELRAALQKSVSVLNAVKQLEVRTSQQVFSGSRTSAESDGGSAAAQSDHKQVVGVLQSFQDDLGVLCAEMGSVAGRSPLRRGTFLSELESE